MNKIIYIVEEWVRDEVRACYFFGDESEAKKFKSRMEKIDGGVIAEWFITKGTIFEDHKAAVLSATGGTMSPGKQVRDGEW